MGRWLEAAKRYSEPLTKLTKPTKPQMPAPEWEVLSVKSVLSEPIETDFEERAAIVEYQAGVPREWAEGYARLLCLPPPPGIRPERWQQIIDDGGRFLDEWADKANRLGWTTLEVFGISPRAPEHRLDMRGLVPALGGHRIVMLTAEAATVDAGGQSRLRIFRRLEDGALPVWEVVCS